jgi:Ca2+-binding RTX toxin-like protein
MRNLTFMPVQASSRHADGDHGDDHHGVRLEQANPVGTRFADILIGVEAADVVIGRGGSDVLRGMGGDDTLIGVLATGKKPGRDEVDVLYGGIGGDTFVLGDFDGGVYYLDKGNKGGGKKSYAGIQDFEDGDKITLRCYEMGEYELDKNYRVGNVIATAIYYNKDGQAGITRGDDLVAVVQGSGAAALDLMNNNQFNWIV